MKMRTFQGMLYRDGRLFAASLWRALLLCALFAVLCAALLLTVLSAVREENEAPVAIALVDEDGSLASHIVLNYVSNQKDVASLATIQKTDAAEALAGVEEGKFSGAVILPKDYLNAIMGGDFTRGKVLLSDGTMIDASLVRRAASIGEGLIQMGQYGVFAGASAVLGDAEARKIYDAYLLKINDTLFYEASTAANRYVTEQETAYVSSSLPLAQHTVLLMLLSLASLSTLFFYRAQSTDLSPALAARLRASGVTTAAFVLPKILYTLFFRIFLCGVALLALSRLFTFSLTPTALLLFGVALVLSSALDTLLSLCLAGNRFGILTLSLFLLVQMFFAGGLIPLHYLAAPIRAVGRFLPLGLSLGLASPIFEATPSPLSLAWLALWVLPMCLLAHRRLRKICTEGGRAK